jgi:hypothetical protein
VVAASEIVVWRWGHRLQLACYSRFEFVPFGTETPRDPWFAPRLLCSEAAFLFDDVVVEKKLWWWSKGKGREISESRDSEECERA